MRELDNKNSAVVEEKTFDEAFLDAVEKFNDEVPIKEDTEFENMYDKAFEEPKVRNQSRKVRQDAPADEFIYDDVGSHKKHVLQPLNKSKLPEEELDELMIED